MKLNDQPNPHVPESEMILNLIKTISRRKQSLFGDEFYKEMNQVLKEEQSQRINVGSNRQSTWKSLAPGGRGSQQVQVLQAGNSANAELAAGNRATTASSSHEHTSVTWSYCCSTRSPTGASIYWQETRSMPHTNLNLDDAPVGTPNTAQPCHRLLASGMYGYILIDRAEGNKKIPELFLGRGKFAFSISRFLISSDSPLKFL